MEQQTNDLHEEGTKKAVEPESPLRPILSPDMEARAQDTVSALISAHKEGGGEAVEAEYLRRAKELRGEALTSRR